MMLYYTENRLLDKPIPRTGSEDTMTPTTFLVIVFLILIASGIKYVLNGETPERRGEIPMESYIPTPGSLEDFMDPASPRSVSDSNHPQYSTLSEPHEE
jgi:hypothetical protein